MKLYVDDRYVGSWPEVRYRRGRGILYVAHLCDWIIQRAHQRRLRRQASRKVSPSTSRFNRRHPR